MLRYLFLEMRPKQWLKNVVILLPVLFVDKLLGTQIWQNLLLIFAFFCLTASSVYIFNDIFDREKDQKHPEKKYRPIASGQLPVSVAVIAALIFLTVSFIFSFSIDNRLGWVLISYVILMFLYSFRLKHIPIVDMMVIAIGFILRIIAGAFALNVLPSNWIIVTTFFFALFFVSVKRRLELKMLEGEATNHRAVLDHYPAEFSDILLGITSTATILSYSIYTLEESVVARLGTQSLIYSVPFVFLFITRLIYLSITDDQVKTSDPTNIILNDQVVLLSSIGWIISVVLIMMIF